MLRAYPATAAELMDSPHTPDPIRSCAWVEEMQVDDVSWRTGCDNLFDFMADGPIENRFNFCPYCGGRLQVAQSREVP